MRFTSPEELRSVIAPPAPTATVTATAVVPSAVVLSTEELRGVCPAGNAATEVARVAAVVVTLTVTAVTSEGRPAGRIVTEPPGPTGVRGAPRPVLVSRKRRAVTGVYLPARPTYCAAAHCDAADERIPGTWGYAASPGHEVRPRSRCPTTRGLLTRTPAS